MKRSDYLFCISVILFYILLILSVNFFHIDDYRIGLSKDLIKTFDLLLEENRN